MRIAHAMVSLAAVLFAATSSTTSGHAETYKWIDSTGAVHITSSPPDDKTATIQSQSEDPPTEESLRDKQRKKDIGNNLQFWYEQRDYYRGKCLQQQTEALCNRSLEIANKKIELLENDPDAYFEHVKKYGLVSSHMPD